MATFSKRVAAAGDDGMIYYGTSYFYPAFGTNYGDINSRAFMRFTAVTIPPGSTVTAATVTVRAAYSEGGLIARLRGHASDNAPSPTTASDVTNAPLTTAASAQWTSTVAAWSGDEVSPDLAAVIQEIVSRAGWASGNALTVIGVDDGSGNPGHFRALAYEDGAATAALLTVTYTAPSSTGVVVLDRPSGLRLSAPEPVLVVHTVTGHGGPSGLRMSAPDPVLVVVQGPMTAPVTGSTPLDLATTADAVKAAPVTGQTGLTLGTTADAVKAGSATGVTPLALATTAQTTKTTDATGSTGLHLGATGDATKAVPVTGTAPLGIGLTAASEPVTPPGETTGRTGLHLTLTGDTSKTAAVTGATGLDLATTAVSERVAAVTGATPLTLDLLATATKTAHATGMTALHLATTGTTPAPAAWSVWDGTTEVPATLEGVWDGTQLVPVASVEVT